MKHLAPVLFLISTAIVHAEDGFKPMLNGKDLTGWILVNTPPETWSFKDGMLICSGKPDRRNADGEDVSELHYGSGMEAHGSAR